MDKKAEIMLARFRQSLESEQFDELTIYTFLIFMRSYLHRSEYPAIIDFCDLIAHRERDRGRAVESMRNAVSNEYRTKEGTHQIIGYNGVDNPEWLREWKVIGQQYNITFNDRAIQDICLCMLSIAQFCEFKNCGEFNLIPKLQ